MHQIMVAPARSERQARKQINWDRLCTAGEMDRALRRETARADRTGREFSLVLFRVRPGPRRHRSTYRVARALLERARLTDEVGWFSDHYLCALLTDTAVCGARAFADHVCASIARRAPRPLAAVYSYPTLPGSAEAVADRLDGDARHPAPAASNGNGHRNGNGHAEGGWHVWHEREQGVELARSHSVDLAARVQTKFASAPDRPGLSSGSVEELLVRRLPAWKRMVDVVGAIVAMILLSPIMLAAAIGIRATSPGPAIFKQRRSGLGGEPFVIYKFRTMMTDAEAKKCELRQHSEQDGPAFKMKEDPRVTRLGRLLRKTSIDELPQLYNVLKGDMSLVGPRPLPCDESDACLLWQRRRLDITPGLTCIWQIEGRSRVTFDEWVRMDVAYMRNRSILRDLSILLRTVPAVLLRRGAR